MVNSLGYAYNIIKLTNTKYQEVIQMTNVITVKEIAIEVKTSPKNLRKWLRTNGIEKPGARWEWPENDEVITKIRNHWNGVEKIKAPARTYKAVETYIEEKPGLVTEYENGKKYL